MFLFTLLLIQLAPIKPRGWDVIGSRCFKNYSEIG